MSYSSVEIRCVAVTPIKKGTHLSPKTPRPSRNRLEKIQGNKNGRENVLITASPERKPSLGSLLESEVTPTQSFGHAKASSLTTPRRMTL